MRDDFDEFIARNAVVERPFHVARKFVRTIERNEARNGDEAAVTLG
jgi:hypothetical protein